MSVPTMYCPFVEIFATLPIGCCVEIDGPRTLVTEVYPKSLELYSVNTGGFVPTPTLVPSVALTAIWYRPSTNGEVSPDSAE